MGNIDDYISQVISQVKSKTVKREIKNELEAHINDRIEYYIDAGYDSDYATETAIQKMGKPDAVAQSMKKIHNNTLYIVLSIVFICCYVVGLIIADIRFYDFAIINMVDFEGVNEFSSIVSVLIFLCGSLAFLFARKSKEPAVLVSFGGTSIAGNVASMYALIPFGYQVVSLVTDFPVAIAAKKYFFYSNEVFWLLDDLFISGMPAVLDFALVIICVLISLLSVVVGIIAIVLANEHRRYNVNKEFSDKVKTFSMFLVILSVITLAGTFAECMYDKILSYNENKIFQNNKDYYFEESKKVFDELEMPMTTQEVQNLESKYNIISENMSDMQFNMLMVFENDGYFVQVRDDDDDGLYETKRFFSSCSNKIGKSDYDTLEKLGKGTSIEELENIVSFAEYSEYSESVNTEDKECYIYIYADKHDEEIYFYYENGILNGGTFIDNDD